MKHDLTNDELTELRTWRTLQEKIKKFSDQSSAHTFIELFKPYDFDEDDNKVYKEESTDLSHTEGFRLFQHFRFDCQHNIEKFKTYLTTSQYNDLMVHLVRIKL